MRGNLLRVLLGALLLLALAFGLTGPAHAAFYYVDGGTVPPSYPTLKDALQAGPTSGEQIDILSGGDGDAGSEDIPTGVRVVVQSPLTIPITNVGFNGGHIVTDGDVQLLLENITWATIQAGGHVVCGDNGGTITAPTFAFTGGNNRFAGVINADVTATVTVMNLGTINGDVTVQYPGGSFSNGGTLNGTLYHAGRYTITLQLAGGALTPPDTATLDTGVGIGGTTVRFTLPTPTRAGCTFGGWTDTLNQVHTATYDATASAMLTAQWTADPPQLASLSVAGVPASAINDAARTATVTVPFTADLSSLTVQAAAGTGQTILEGSPFTVTVVDALGAPHPYTVTAQAGTPTLYTLTLNANGGSLSGQPSYTYAAQASPTFDLTAPGTPTHPMGRAFLGWRTPGGQLVTSTYTAAATGETLTAEWNNGGLPGAPSLTVTPGDGEVRLTWTPPVSDGGSPVTKYHVYRDGVLLASLPAGQTAYTDTTAASGQVYTYTVVAENAAGVGAVSAGARRMAEGGGPSNTEIGMNVGGETVSTMGSAQAWVANCAEWVNVRSGPGTEYNVVGRASLGDALRVRQVYEGWCEAYVSEAFIGWIHLDYVQWAE